MRWGLRALSRLLGGEHPHPRTLDPDRLLFLLLLSWCSREELPGLPERDLRRPGPQEPLLGSLPLAFLLLARSWLLERSLEDLRPLALGRCLLAWSSATNGDTDLELPFLEREPEWEPEREPERVLPCSLVGACFLLAFFRLRELDVERERERGGDRSSTTRWVVVGGMSGSATVT